MTTPRYARIGWKAALALAVSLVVTAGAASSALAGKAAPPPPPPPPPANPAITYLDTHKAKGVTYSDLMVMNADGSNQRRVYSSAGTLSGPDWSPDGQRLVFWNQALTGLCSIQVDGTGLTPIVATVSTAGGLAQPCWSPGPVPGTLGGSVARIAYADDVPPLSGDSVTELFLVSPDGSDKIRLTDTPGVGEESPTWSPSGTRLAFAMYTNLSETSHRTIGIYDFEAGTFSYVTPGGALAGGTVTYPSWSKNDANKIAVRGTTAAGTADGVWVLDLADPDSPQLVAGYFATRPTWSSDDTRIVFQGNGIEGVNADGSGARATLSSTGTHPGFRRNP